MIRLGGTRVILPGNAPIGCYPYILTELATNDTSAYDDVGCLKTVNDFIVYKNDDLKQAIEDLREEYPDILIFYADFYSSMTSLIRETYYKSKFLLHKYITILWLLVLTFMTIHYRSERELDIANMLRKWREIQLQ